mgnify:FL=1
MDAARAATRDERRPGLVALLGSGETAAAGGRIFESLAQALPRPLRVVVLETPAGFELNSDRVAGRVAEFLRVRLANYGADVIQAAALRRDGPRSTGDPLVTEPLLHADLIFAGPGSPTYAVRHLAGSLAWQRALARHALGAALALASAATIAAGRWALPVYEIYKAGHDPFWSDGLDLLGPFGLSLAIVPHWNNNDGGTELDTSRCFMGRERFEAMAAGLPAGTAIVGLDEHTGLVINLAAGNAAVRGAGGVTLRRDGSEHSFAAGATFALELLGPFRLVDGLAALPPAIVAEALAAAAADASTAAEPAPPAEVAALAEAREAARERRDWTAADELRDRIAALGWQVQDTPQGPELLPWKDKP